MAPPISNTSAEPTLYDILALTPKHLEGQAGAAQQQKIVKQAYHRALLKHHPDKAASNNNSEDPRDSKTSSSPSPSSKPNSKQTPQPRIQYTVDQIQHAYAVLSDRRKRAEYDRSLRAAPSSSSSSQWHSSTFSFQTGVETVDLDDLAFDERGGGVYYRGCRCGNPRGYAFTEQNLEEFEDDGVLMVECLDCSLWIRVLFAAAESEGEDGDFAINTTAAPGAVGSTSAGGAGSTMVGGERGEDAVAAGGERRGSVTGRGFTFNWSFNWGISLSGGATASMTTGAETSGPRR